MEDLLPQGAMMMFRDGISPPKYLKLSVFPIRQHGINGLKSLSFQTIRYLGTLQLVVFLSMFGLLKVQPPSLEKIPFVILDP
jgi:hypothetical protein